jgi:hypothetical protein
LLPLAASNVRMALALAADYFAKVFGVNAKLENRALRLILDRNLHVLWMIHEGPGDGFHQFLHGAPPRLRT